MFRIEIRNLTKKKTVLVKHVNAIGYTNACDIAKRICESYEDGSRYMFDYYVYNT